MQTKRIAILTALSLLIGGCSSPEAALEARYESFMGKSIDLSEVEAPYHEFFAEPRDLEDYKIAQNDIGAQSSGAWKLPSGVSCANPLRFMRQKAVYLSNGMPSRLAKREPCV